MNSFTVTGSVPMKEGMLSVFWASDWPAASVSTQAKSLDSLTRVENDVRRSALAASSTAEIVRRHRISSVTASKGWLAAGRDVSAMPDFLSADGDDDVAAGGDLEAAAGADDEGRLALLDDGGAVEGLRRAASA